MAMKAVRMLRAYASNTAGDVCGFEEAEADRLIAAKMAEPVTPTSPKVAASAPELPPLEEVERVLDAPPVHKMETGRRRK